MTIKMITSKDLESYVKVNEFMVDNNVKDVYDIAKMTGAKLALMIVESEDGESRKFYTLASAAKFVCVDGNYVLHPQESQD